MTAARQLDQVPWLHQARGPFAVERTDRRRGTDVHSVVLHRTGFVQAMEAFWYPDIGQPSVRSVIDATGTLILWQMNGAEVGFAATLEVAEWCRSFLPADAIQALGWVFAFFKHVNGQGN